MKTPAQARRWAFAIRTHGRQELEVWGREHRRGRRRVIETWLSRRPAGGERPGRSFSELVTDARLRPLAYTVLDGSGREQAVLRFRGDAVDVRFADGTRLDVPSGGARFLLGANALSHLAAIVAEALPSADSTWSGTVFAPEALQAVPYRLERSGTEVTTNLGEQLVLDEHGLAALRVADRGIEAERTRARPPAWPAKPKARATPREPRYRRPAGIRVTDGATTGRDPAVGYSLVEPERRDASAMGLFIAGSGAHDRHGLAGDLDLGYHDLLDRLALRGLASVRFDSRGAGTTPLGADVLEYGFESRLADARRCRLVAEHAGRGLRLVLLGHSEGAIAALALANERPPDGVVLMAAPARPATDVIREQVRASAARAGLDEEELRVRLAAYDELVELAQHIGDEEWEAGRVPDRLVSERGLARYLRELSRYDVTTLVEGLRCPLLVVHGSADQQVPVESARAIGRIARGAGLDVELRVVEGANHLLKSSSSPPSVLDYYDRRRRVVREVVDAIATWSAGLGASFPD